MAVEDEKHENTATDATETPVTSEDVRMNDEGAAGADGTMTETQEEEEDDRRRAAKQGKSILRAPFSHDETR